MHNVNEDLHLVNEYENPPDDDELDGTGAGGLHKDELLIAFYYLNSPLRALALTVGFSSSDEESEEDEPEDFAASGINITRIEQILTSWYSPFFLTSLALGADIAPSLDSDGDSDEEDEDDGVFAFLSVDFVFLSGELALGASFSSSLESDEDEAGVFAFFSLVFDLLADVLELELESELLEATLTINKL